MKSLQRLLRCSLSGVSMEGVGDFSAFTDGFGNRYPIADDVRDKNKLLYSFEIAVPVTIQVRDVRIII